MDINLFTAAMRTEFLRSSQAVAEPAPVDKIITTVPSTARIENYSWMTPAPGISRYVGRRRKAQLDAIKYTVENREYDGTLTVPIRDIEDDQVGGYKIRMADLTKKAGAPFRSQLVLSHLANGGTATCFDGSAFFATSHTIGSAGSAPYGFGGGGNALTYDAASNDGVTHRLIMLYHGGDLKPLMFQNRKPAQFNTDAGTPASIKAKEADYWIDLEAAAAFGYWWDAVRVTITDTPTLTELFAIIDGCRQCFRRFQLPKALDTDPNEYPHEQTQFGADNTTIVCSTGLEQLLNHALNEDRVGVSVAGSTGGITSNIYYKKFGLIATNRLD